MPMTHIMPVVAAALVDGQGRVLVQQRPPGKSLGGLWEFPGGKVEPGETPEVALIRELAEELGITVGIDALRPVAFASHALAARHLLLLLYRIDVWRGEPVALEATTLAWESPAGLRGLPMPPADVPLVDALARLLG